MKPDTLAARTMQEIAVLEVMTQHARARTATANRVRTVLVILALLAFPITLPVYVVWWLITRCVKNR